jgi:acyl-CoA reductase-like NAD-dependent aldehyde dehydrogenase
VDDRRELFVGGTWVPATGEIVQLVSPHSEQPTARVTAASVGDVDRAVAAARLASDNGPWSRVAPADRVDAVRRLLVGYEQRAPEMAALISAEMGAPITFAGRAHVGLPLAMSRALCDVAGSIGWVDQHRGAFGGQLVVRREPVGVVATIVPWNMPQFLILTKVVPALVAGCAVVVKPAEETPLDALLLAEVVAEADLPAGVFNVVPGGRDVGAHLAAHPDVDKVSFTGSTDAGRHVAAACAANLTPVTLELGGKSAAVVLDDAEPASVATGIRFASLSNSGQICNALTRVLVPDRRADDFIDALATTASGLRVGDPTDPDTELGPLVSRRQHERVLGYIDDGIHAGARLVTGGARRPDGVERGYYVRPTVFAGVDNDMRIAREEIFGPVLVVIPYRDEAHAVRIANDSDYGLAGAVWTEDIEHGLDIAARVRTGTFGVNQGYSMDPAAPFGGVKASGYGRELGAEGIESYLDVKSISVAG